MRFTVLAAPGSDPSPLSGRAAAVVNVGGPAALAAAARAAQTPWIVLLGAGARPRAGALAGLAAPPAGLGVAGGAAWSTAAHAHGDVTQVRCGYMIGPPSGVLPFELVPVIVAAGPGADALVRGPVDVAAPEMLLADARLLHDPLPSDPVAAAVELCARARERGLDVVCKPSIACDAPPPSPDDRGRTTELRALARARPELVARHRLPPAMRLRTIDRDVRMEGGRRVRVRRDHPPVALLVHGPDADRAARSARDAHPAITSARGIADAAALRDALRVRGDRYAIVCASHRVPDAAGIAALVEAVETSATTAAAALERDDLDGACVLLAAGRIPQHIVAAGATVTEGVRAMLGVLPAIRRGIAAPNHRVAVPALTPRARATVVFLASSMPEIARITLDAALGSVGLKDEVIAVCSAGAQTTRRLLGAYPQVRVEIDAADPLLGSAANRVMGGAQGDLVVLLADDVILAPRALERMRAAFARVPALGAAVPCVPGAVTPEGVADVRYADLQAHAALANARAQEFARMTEPIDVASSPAIAIAREALVEVGGLDPRFGPTRAGIADLVTRLRAAGYTVVRCDDALAHRFDGATSHNPAALADAATAAPVADAARIAGGFDPATRVAFDSGAGQPAPRDVSVAIAVPVSGAAELERAAVFVAAANAVFDASSPVRVHVIIEGALSGAEVAARLRPVLAGGGKPLDASVSVRMERSTDLAAWRAAIEPSTRVVVASGHERPQLDGITAITPRELPRLVNS